MCVFDVYVSPDCLQIPFRFEKSSKLLLGKLTCHNNKFAAGSREQRVACKSVLVSLWGLGCSLREKMKPCCSKHCLSFSPGPKVNFSAESQIGCLLVSFLQPCRHTGACSRDGYVRGQTHTTYLTLALLIHYDRPIFYQPGLRIQTLSRKKSEEAEFSLDEYSRFIMQRLLPRPPIQRQVIISLMFLTVLVSRLLFDIHVNRGTQSDRYNHTQPHFSTNDYFCPLRDAL